MSTDSRSYKSLIDAGLALQEAGLSLQRMGHRGETVNTLDFDDKQQVKEVLASVTNFIDPFEDDDY